MRKILSIVLISMSAATTTSLMPTPAHAGSVRVTDADTEAPPWYLEATSATFTNGSKRVSATIEHKAFNPMESVDGLAMAVDVPGPSSYHLSWSYSSGSLRLVRVEGHGLEKVVRCPGKNVGLQAGTPGYVRVSIPQKCLGGTKRARFNYYATNYTAVDPGQETVPGTNQNDLSYTRWVKRG